MNNQLIRTLICLALMGQGTALWAQQYTFMTYNIRLDHAGDGPDQWQYRKEALAAVVMQYRPAAVGFQEVLKNQLDFLDQHLPGYQRFGVGREDGAEKGEYSPVYIDTSIFELISGRTLWMSDTPETPGKGWDAACERVASLVVLRDRKTGDTCLVANTHWDHIGTEARLRSAYLIKKALSEGISNSKRAVFMGDLNATPDAPPIEQLKQMLTEACPASLSTQGTFNGFDVNRTTFPRIDYVWFSAGHWQVESYEVPQPKVNDRHVSDHFPVVVKLRAY